MKRKFISIFLVAIFLLQLLPIRQVVQYFGIDNVLVEEVPESGKLAVKDFADLDLQVVNDHRYSQAQFYCPVSIVFSGFYKAMLPSSHADDIEVPPPNEGIS